MTSLRSRALTLTGIMIIVASLAMGGLYYWGGTTIIADTTPPVIDQAASTHGSVAYGAGEPTVLLFVDENLGMASATAELKTKGVLGLGVTSIEKITLSLDQKLTSTIYKYKGAFTKQLEQNTEYTLVYTATDAAGHTDKWSTNLKTVNVAGEVTVNGVKVEGPDAKVYVTSLDLNIKVTITQGSGSVTSVYGVVNGERLDFTAASQLPPGGGGTMPGENSIVDNGAYAAQYTLPKDGSYAFTVVVLDSSGVDTQLASFTVQVGGQYQTLITVGLLGLLAVGCIVFYLKPGKKTGKGREQS